MEGKGNITPVRVGVQTATTSMEISAKVPREVKMRSATRSSHSALECICKGLYLTTETLAHLHFLPLCSQSPEIEKSLDVQPLINE